MDLFKKESMSSYHNSINYKKEEIIFFQKISEGHSIIQQIDSIYIVSPYSLKCTGLSAEEVQDLVGDLQTALNESVNCYVGK